MNNLLTIQQAASLLGVSTKTLRRWEAKGVLVPQRTVGNQRRYSLTQLEKFQAGKVGATEVPDDSKISSETLSTDTVSSQAPVLTDSTSSLHQERLSQEFAKSITTFKKLAISGAVVMLFIVISSLAFATLKAGGIDGKGLAKVLGVAGFGTAEDERIDLIEEAGAESKSVLGIGTQATNLLFGVNVPSEFAKNVNFLESIKAVGIATLSGGIVTENANIDAGTGELTASNVIYSLTAGDGIDITPGQTPTITNTGVLSLGGSTGDVVLTAGTGISISGTTISNTLSASSSFKNILVGSSTITAGSAEDNLTFAVGSGLSIAANTSTKTVTITPGGLIEGSPSCVTTTNGIVTGTGVCQLGSEQWTVSNGTLYPTQGTLDVLIGNAPNNGTNSANFAFINNSGGTPTFRISLQDVLTSTTLGTSVTNSSLTGLGTISSGTWGPLATAIATSSGGLGQREYIKGDIIYASANNTLTRLPATTNGYVLSLNAGVPTWTSASGAGLGCTDCVLNDPTSSTTQEVNPASGIVPLSLRANGADILRLQSNGGSTLYANVDSSGNFNFPASNLYFAGGTLYNIDTSANSNFNIARSNQIQTGYVNGNIISTGSGTLTFGGSNKVFTVNKTLTLDGTDGVTINADANLDINAHSLVFNNGAGASNDEILTLTQNKDVTFGDAFTTLGSFPLTLTTIGNTNVTLPLGGLLLTATAASNQTIDSTQTTGTIFGIRATSNPANERTGQLITLSGSSSLNAQKGLAFDLSGLFGSTAIFDLFGTNGSWYVRATGAAAFSEITTTNSSASITNSGVFYASNGTAGAPSYSFTNSTATGLYLPSTNNIGISTSGTERIRIDSSGNVGIGNTSPTSLLSVSGAPPGKALAVFNYTGTDQNILVASSSGATKFVVGNTGNIQFAGGASVLTTLTSSASLAQSIAIPDTAGAGGTFCLSTNNCGYASSGSSINYWDQSSGALQPLNKTVDLLLGGNSTATAKFAFINNNPGSGIPTASISGTIGNNALTLTGNGQISTNNSQVLTLGGGGTGDINLSIATGNNLRINGSIGSTITGTAQCVTTQNGIVTGTGVCQLGSEQWVAENGTLHPGLATVYDLLLGGDTTTSAKFAFINNNSGTPTASIAGNLTLNSAGKIQSTNSQTLTIGGDSTGNIVFKPQNSSNNTTGLITFFGKTALGGNTYTWPSAALQNNYVLQTQSDGTLTWIDPSTLGTNYWDQTNGALYPKFASVVDLFLGSNATSSAEFSVTGINNGTPVASLSATTSVDANGLSLNAFTGTIQSLNRGTLTLGGTTTGNISLSATGYTRIGDTGTPGIATGDDALYVEGNTEFDSTVYFDAINAINIQNPSGTGIDFNGISGVGIDMDDLSGSGVGIDFDVLNSGTVGIQFDSTLAGTGISIAPSSAGTGSGIGISLSNTVSSGSLANYTGDALSIKPNRTYTGNSSVTDTGNLIDIARVNAQLTGSGTFNVTGDVVDISSTCSGTCVDSSKILSLSQNYTGSTGNVLDVTGLGLGVGLNLSANSGGQAAVIINKTGNNDILTASSSGTARFVIGNTGNIQFGGGQTALSTLTKTGTTARTFTFPDEAGTICLQSSANCGFALGTNYWQTTGDGKALTPLNNTWDLLLGGDTTASAKFAVKNIAGSLIPIASISAQNVAGQSLYLTADGTLATTRRGSLTIGNSSSYDTTGNVLINPNGTGSLYVGTGFNVTGAGAVTGTTFNGNTITAGTGTLTLGTSTLTVNSSTALNAHSIGFGGTSPTETLTLASGKNVAFTGEAITFNGFTTTGVDLPHSGEGTLLTDDPNAFSQIIASSKTAASSADDAIFGITDSTNITGGNPFAGMRIYLTPTDAGGNNLIGQAFKVTCSTTCGTLYDLLGTNSAWSILSNGQGNFGSIIPTGTSGTFGWLQRNNGALSPKNISDDLLLGGISTTAARIAFTGIASGQTPTASLSATTTGLVLAADGTIQSLRNGTLTIGGDSTGNITLKPLNGSLTNGIVDIQGKITSASWSAQTVDFHFGGTGQSSYSPGDLLYANAAGVLTKLNKGSQNQVLFIDPNSPNLPKWGTVLGGPSASCTNCVVIDPTTTATNTITASATGVTPLIVRGTSDASANIFTVQNNAGSTDYFNIDSTGTITKGVWGSSATPIATTSGGLGQTAYVTGDLIYASAPTSLTPLRIGSVDQVLAVSAGGLPVWTTVSGGGGLCSNCVVNNPSTNTVNTINPGSNVVPLTLRANGSDILRIQSNAGGTTHAYINSTGDFVFNDSLIFANGAQSNLYNIDTNGNSRLAIDKSNKVETGFVNGNIISTGSGTLTLNTSTLNVLNSLKLDSNASTNTLTLNASISANTHSIRFNPTAAAGQSEELFLTAGKDVTFGNTFTTAGTNSITLRSNGSNADVLLPVSGTGTLLTNTPLTNNQLITSTQTSGTGNSAILAINDVTNPTAAITGLHINLHPASSAGGYTQTGLSFFTGCPVGTCGTVYDISGTNNSWWIKNDGTALFGNVTSSSSSGAFGWLQKNNGTLSPTNITDDLLLGGVSTSTAKFAFYNNIGSGVPTASLSAGTNSGAYLTASGILATRANQSLTLGGSETGNLVLNNPAFGSSTGRNAVLYATNTTGVLGSATTTSNGLCLISNDTTNIPGWGTCPGAGSGGSSLWSENSSVLYPTTISNRLAVGTTTPAEAISSFYVTRSTGSTALGKAVAIFNQTESQDIIAASASGTPRFVVTNGGSIQLAANQTIDTISSGTLGIGTTTAGAITIGRSSQNITLPTFTKNGGLLYTSGTGLLTQLTSQGSNGDCLVSGGDGNLPSFSNCASAAGDDWDMLNGALSPRYASTLDLLLGSTATATSKFAFINVNSGTPTASISANSGNNATFLTGLGNLATTNMQPLSLGGSSTGDITLNARNGLGTVSITSDLSQGGRTAPALSIIQAQNASNNTTGPLVQLTNSDSLSTSEVLNITQSANSGTALKLSGFATGIGLDINAPSTTGIGINISSAASGSVSFSGSYINIAPTKTATATLTDSGNFLKLNRSNTVNTSGGTYLITGDVAAFSSNCTQTAGTCIDASHILSLTQSYGLATGSALFVSNSGQGIGLEINSNSGGQAAAIINKTGNNDIFAASSSGTTRFVITNDGSLKFTGAGGTSLATLAFAGGGTPTVTFPNSTGTVCLDSNNCGFALGTNYWTLSSPTGGALTPVNSTLDLLIGGTSTSTAKFAFKNVNAGTPIATLSAQSSNTAVYLTADGTLATESRKTLTIGNSSSYNTTGNVLINPNGTGRVGIGTTNPNNIFEVANYISFNSSLSSTALGFQALNGNTGSQNTAVGQSALSTNNSGTGNSAFGYQALKSNSSGSENLAIGYNALQGNSSGADNTGVGYSALSSNSTGNYNTAIGSNALGTSNSSNNTAIGYYSLYDSTGVSNTALGYNAGYTNSGQYSNGTGGNNTYLGYNAGPWLQTATFNNSTAIGAYALVYGSNNLVLGGTGSYAVNVGIGTATPSATLDVQGGNRGGNSLAIFNQTGAATNDILAASSSGVTRFVVTNDGSLKFTGGGGTSLATLAFAGGGTPVVTFPNATGTVCLSTNNCGYATSVGTNYWQLVSGGGAIAPINDTVDLFVGGQSTTAAKFAITGINGSRGTQIATLSGSLVLDSSTASIQTTNGQTLTIGGDKTGVINIADKSNATFAMFDTINGRVGIGNTAPTSLLSVGSSSQFTVSATGAVVGTTFNGLAITANGANTLNIAAGKSIVTAGNFTTSGVSNLTLTTTADSNVTLPTTGTLITNTASANQTIDSTQTSGNIFGLTDSGTNYSGDVTGFDLTLDKAGATNKYGIKFNISSGTNVYDLYGTTGWYVKADGTALFGNVSTSSSSGTFGWLQRNNGALAPTNITDDLLLGGISTSTAKFAFINNIGAGTPTASISAGTNGATYLTAAGVLSTTAKQSLVLGSSTTGDINFKPSNIQSLFLSNIAGRVGLGTQTSPKGLLDIAGDAGDNAALIVNGTGGDDLITASASGSTVFTVTNGGNITAAGTTGLSLTGNDADITFSGSNGAGAHDITASNGTLRIGAHTLSGAITGNAQDITGLSALSATGTVTFSGTTINLSNSAFTTDNNNILYTTNGSGALGVASTSTQNQCLTSGASTPSWVDCSGAAGDDWNVSNGAISPKLASTLDLLLGGTTTASAKFAVLNINSGTPVASVSATSTGAGIALGGDGVIQSLRKNNLTLGGDTTGGINFKPGNIQSLFLSSIAGRVGLGTQTSPKGLLDIAGDAGDNASLIVNNTGGDDIFTASSSGTTRFKIGTLGGITATLPGANQDALLTGYYGTDTQPFFQISAINAGLLWGPGGSTAWDTDLYRDSASALKTDGRFIIAGNTKNNAALLINNTDGNASDLIAASASGTTKFRVTNSGDVVSTGHGAFGSTAASSFSSSNGTTFAIDDPATTGYSNYIGQSTTLNLTGASVTTGSISRLIAKSDASYTYSTLIGLDINTASVNGSTTGYKGINIGTPRSGALNTDSYQLYINDIGPVNSGTGYGIYQTGTSGYNILNANTAVGTTTKSNALLTVSGNGGFNNAALIVNQTNSFDILAASTSGVTKFRLTNEGNLVSVAGAQWLPLTNSNQGLQIANAAGTSMLNFDTINTGIYATSSATTTNAFSIAPNSLSTGTGLNLTTTSTAISSANLLKLNHTATYTAGGAISGNLANLTRSITSNGSSSSSYNSDGSSGTDANWVHTMGSGNNRLLIVAVHVVGDATPAAPTITSVQYGDSSSPNKTLTLIPGCAAVDPSSYQRTGMYYLAESDISAANGSTVKVTLSGTPDNGWQGESASFSNVQQPGIGSGPFRATCTTDANFSASSPFNSDLSVTSVSGDIVVSAAAERNLSGSPAVSNSQTTVYQGTFDSVAASGMSYATANSASTTMRFTLGSSGFIEYSHVGVSLIPSPLAITGALASFSSNCTVSAGGCADTSNILSLTQSYGPSTGAVLDIAGSGLGTGLNLSANAGGQAAVIINKSVATGDIFTASASGSTKFVIQNNGDTGIGVANPLFRLDVSDSQSATAAAQILNSNTGTDADGLIVKLGNTSTTVASSTNHFINFETAGIGVVGSIQGSGAKGVTYKTNGVADFAEYFRKDQNDIPYGSLVCLSESGLVEVCSPGSTRLIGVASEHPAFVGGIDLGDSSIAVGFVGQIETRVSTANGEIMPGDPLRQSSIPGVAVKSTETGPIIGRAVEGYNDASEGKILVSVNPTWYQPGITFNSDGSLYNPLAQFTNEEKDSLLGLLNSSTASGSASLDLSNDPLFQDVQNRVATAETTLTVLGDRTSTAEGRISDLQSSVANLASQSAFLTEMLASMSGEQASGSSQFANLTDLDIENATISGDLNVLGRARVTDLGVTGNIAAGLLSIHGLDSAVNGGSGGATINSIGDLNLQNNGLGGINILAGKIMIDTDGNIKTEGEITAKKIKIDTTTDEDAASLGTGTIEAGETEINIEITAVTSKSRILVTATTKTENQVLVVTEKSAGTGFKVEIEDPISADIKFDWWIVDEE